MTHHTYLCHRGFCLLRLLQTVPIIHARRPLHLLLCLCLCGACEASDTAFIGTADGPQQGRTTAAMEQ